MTPVEFGPYIVAGSAAGPMRFINPANGVIEKTIELNQAHTPLVLDDEIIVGSQGGSIYKVNQYGKVVTSRKISDDAISSIVKWKNGYAVTIMGGTIFHISAEDLQVLNTFELGSDQSAVFGKAVRGDSTLSVYSSRNRLYLFR